MYNTQFSQVHLKKLKAGPKGKHRKQMGVGEGG